MRKTKIICTIGPACENEEVLKKMCLEGMNVARINFSYGTHEEHLKKIQLVKKVREELNLPIAIMIDTKGPEYQIETFENKKITVTEDEKFTLMTENVIGDESYLREYDKKDLLFAIENGVDFVAASFVSSKKDIQDLREFLDENGGKDIEIIAKIENRTAADNVDEICEAVDEIMAVRGDFGAENLLVQKMLVLKCRLLEKNVIIATEMMESMIYRSRPTRTEISYVANAVYDGASAIVLLGETTIGKYPVEAVRNIAKIVEHTEYNMSYRKTACNCA